MKIQKVSVGLVQLFIVFHASSLVMGNALSSINHRDASKMKKYISIQLVLLQVWLVGRFCRVGEVICHGSMPPFKYFHHILIIWT
jgi:hypothetical protein